MNLLPKSSSAARMLSSGVLLVCLCLCICCCLLSGCRTQTGDEPSGTLTEESAAPSAEGTETVNEPESAPETEPGALTLQPEEETRPEPETAVLPTASDLDPDADYGRLVITSFYAAGLAADDARCEASFVELFNGGDRALSLAGVSLWVSNGGDAYTEYRFRFGDSIPAGGCFLIRGADAKGRADHVLSVGAYDVCFPSMGLDARDVRLVLSPAGQKPDPAAALAGAEGVFAYVSAHKADVSDEFHYVKSLSADKLARKKADTDKLDYQTIDLTRAQSSVLAQITPRTSGGRVNTDVRSLIPEVTFSAPSGVYEKGFDLSLSAPEGWTIYYVVNDTDPRRPDFRTGGPIRYTTPLHLHDTTDMAWGPLTKMCVTRMGSTYYPLASSFPGASVIRAYARNDEDGTVTPLSTATYFIGSEFLTWKMDVCSVSVVTEEFMGARGIYLNSTGTHDHIAAYLEYFDPAGAPVYAGWTEIALNGRGSLGMRQKSFRVVFKSDPMDSGESEENLNVFSYDLFGEYGQYTPDGERVTWFRHLLLRNGGGDNSGCTISRSHIGDAYIQRVNRFLTPDDMSYAPVMVFINGEFFGLYNARDRLDVKFFMMKYGVPEESLAVLECPYPIQNGQWVTGADYLVVSGTEDAADPFNQLCEYARTHDLTKPEEYEYVCSQLDVLGLIDQFCGQMYLCCSDWPNNNVKVWRCTDPSIMDTKWHFTYVDTDHGVGLNSTYRDNLMGAISDGSKLGILINHLMTNKEFRALFLQRYIWCTEVYYDPARLTAELDELVGRITPVMQYQLDRWRVTDGTVTTWDKWWSYIEIIREFVQKRPAYVKEQIKAWGGLSEKYYNQHLQTAIGMWGDKVG